MGNLKDFKKWSRVNEIRKPRKCPIPDFTPLRESTLYADLISLGYTEVDAKGNPRLEGETFQGERQGNLRFKHEAFPMSIRMNLNGAIWEDAPSGRAYRIMIEYDHNPKWYKPCLDMKDYENRLEYLIKKLLHKDKFITKEELLNTEGGVEIIKRKLGEDPTSVKSLRVVPTSLKGESEYIKSVADLGLF